MILLCGEIIFKTLKLYNNGKTLQSTRVLISMNKVLAE